MVQGVTRLCMTSVLIKPPPNQGDDGWHLQKN
jgi:hypothetical protein